MWVVSESQTVIIGDVAHPQLVGCRRDEVPDEVGIGRQPVAGVGRPRCPHPSANLQAPAVYQVLGLVTAYRTDCGELPVVHVPQFHASDARVFRPDLTYVLQGELLLRGLGQLCVLVSFVVCLLAHTKQPAKDAHGIAFRVPRVQVCHRLTPAFFSYLYLELLLRHIDYLVVQAGSLLGQLQLGLHRRQLGLQGLDIVFGFPVGSFRHRLLFLCPCHCGCLAFVFGCKFTKPSPCSGMSDGQNLRNPVFSISQFKVKTDGLVVVHLFFQCSIF